MNLKLMCGFFYKHNMYIYLFGVRKYLKKINIIKNDNLKFKKIFFRKCINYDRCKFIHVNENFTIQ